VGKDDDGLFEVVRSLEKRVINDVSLVTGDREFPDDLRQHIQGIIAVHAIQACAGLPESEDSKQWLLSMRSSRLVEKLHGAFHDVARRRPPNRYDSFFSDDPSAFLRARDRATSDSSV
jgi:hypothetical protein